MRVKKTLLPQQNARKVCCLLLVTFLREATASCSVSFGHFHRSLRADTLAHTLAGARRARGMMRSVAYALAGLLAACICLASAQDLPPITLSGQSSGPAAVYTGAGAGAQDATCDTHGPRKQCGVRRRQALLCRRRASVPSLSAFETGSASCHRHLFIRDGGERACSQTQG